MANSAASSTGSVSAAARTPSRPQHAARANGAAARSRRIVTSSTIAPAMMRVNTPAARARVPESGAPSWTAAEAEPTTVAMVTQPSSSEATVPGRIRCSPTTGASWARATATAVTTTMPTMSTWATTTAEPPWG